MASQSTSSFAERSKRHAHPLARKLFNIAERKKSNVVLSADLTTTKDLLAIADSKSVQGSLLKRYATRHCLLHHVFLLRGP